MTGNDDNNLHRALAPISAGAWTQIQEEASRTVKRNLAARRVVDVTGPLGFEFAAVTTGHVADIAAPSAGLVARSRGCCRWSRSGCRSRWIARPSTTSPADRRIRIGSRSRTRPPPSRTPRTGPCSTGTPRPRSPASGRPPAIQPITLPADARNYPDAVEQALSQLRLAGVEGPYALVLDAEAYTAVSETRDHGYPILRAAQPAGAGRDHLGAGAARRVPADHPWRRLRVDDRAGHQHRLPAAHRRATVDLYLQETFTFAPYTSEASVYLSR